MADAEVDALVEARENAPARAVEEARLLEERAQQRALVLVDAHRLLFPRHVDRTRVRVEPPDAGALHDRRLQHGRALLELAEGGRRRRAPAPADRERPVV